LGNDKSSLFFKLQFYDCGKQVNVDKAANRKKDA